MTELGIRELREQLATVIGRAQHGGQVTDVLRNNKLAARVVPPEATVITAAEAGGDPVQLITAAGEAIRAANHTTVNRNPVPGMAAAANLYSAVGALHTLVGQRLPQQVEQLADLLAIAEEAGTLEGPEDAPAAAVAELRAAVGTLKAAGAHLDRAWTALSPVGGWLGPDAQKLVDEEED